MLFHSTAFQRRFSSVITLQSRLVCLLENTNMDIPKKNAWAAPVFISAHSDPSITNMGVQQKYQAKVELL
jgi:hypothetical protein